MQQVNSLCLGMETQGRSLCAGVMCERQTKQRQTRERADRYWIVCKLCSSQVSPLRESASWQTRRKNKRTKHIGSVISAWGYDSRRTALTQTGYRERFRPTFKANIQSEEGEKKKSLIFFSRLSVLVTLLRESQGSLQDAGVKINVWWGKKDA